MTADKRTVATDALETLGMIITESEKRDAIHPAVEPAMAAHTLRPGEDVGFIDGGVGVCDKPAWVNLGSGGRSRSFRRSTPALFGCPLWSSWSSSRALMVILPALLPLRPQHFMRCPNRLWDSLRPV